MADDVVGIPELVVLLEDVLAELKRLNGNVEQVLVKGEETRAQVEDLAGLVEDTTAKVGEGYREFTEGLAPFLPGIIARLQEVPK